MISFNIQKKSGMRGSFFIRRFYAFCLTVAVLSTLTVSGGEIPNSSNLPGNNIISLKAELSLSDFLDQNPPTVRFNGLRHYSRVSNQQPVLIEAADDIGLSRVELHVDGVLIGANNISANATGATVFLVWNTTAQANGKHFLQAKAFDTAGNSQTTTLIVLTHNYFITPPTGNTIALNPYMKFQKMDGWEATAEAGQLDSPAFNNYKNQLFDLAVNDLGINRLRLEIKSGIENPVDYFAQWRNGQITESQYKNKRYEIINDDSNPNTINPNGFKWTQLDNTIDNVVLPMRDRLQARGEKLWININYVDFGASAFEHKNNANEYAEFVLATYQHLQNTYGFAPDSWEVVLEPDASDASWSAGQVANAIKAAGDRLSANGFTPRFVAPSTTSAANALLYIDQIAQTNGAMTYVGEFSYHRYCCASDSVLQSIYSRTLQYNKRAAMLEWIGAGYDTLHDDILYGRNSSWQQFTLGGPAIWGPDNGDRYYIIDDNNINNPVISMGSRTKFLRQYFKFVRYGAQRIEALTGNDLFDPIAFINTNGKYVVIVKSSTNGSIKVQGLPAGTYGIKYTTDSQYNVDLPDTVLTGGATLNTSLPASGVITVYQK